MNNSRTQRPNRYGEAYNFGGPQASRAPRSHGYEYVGTEEPPPSYPGSPRHAYASMNHPPRQSGAYSRMPRTSVSPPPVHSRRASPPPRGRRDAPPHKNPMHKYQDFAQRPGVKRAQTYGKKGLNILGDAAAAYMATQGPEPRGRSMPRHSYDAYPEPRRSHRRGRQPSYSPSPSPPPRRGHGRHGERGHLGKQGRRDTYSESPPRSRRDADRYDRDRGHRRDKPSRRAYSYSPSPSRTRDRDGRKSAGSSGLIAGLMSGGKSADNPNAARWQAAARAALEAGGATALRIRKDPGSWTGDKGAKVATAALGAGAMKAMVGGDRARSRDRGGGGSSGMKGMATSAITGMLASKLMGGGSKRRKSR